MIIARYGRRPKHAKHALNAAAGDCSLGVRVPEMIAESLLFGRLFACLHTANTAPARINELCSQQRVLQQKIEDQLPRQRCSTVVSINLHVCLFCGMLVLRALLTFLSHFALAFAQCTQAIGIRSGDSMPGQIVESRLDRMCNGVRKATLLALERRDEVLGRGLGRSGGVQVDSAIWGSGSSLRMKTAHWSRWYW
jgi:hypothetical protein